ncbi:hypothetical protein GCM10010211_78820 [Streptomyces albospinus]|uniref:Phosphatidylserine decarboxylase n=1 Tax=Streptomyces albospinus TaxID=285515 RepID=A0ABQ2VQ72_9ACTN|nr:hypothetical protein GCM10010211_78820 [Streptomyces albospinus]
MVCAVVIGMEEVSSIDWSVGVGDTVQRGQELGYFSYGGSSMALVFEQGIVDEFTVPFNKPPRAHGRRPLPAWRSAYAGTRRRPGRFQPRRCVAAGIPTCSQWIF